MSYIGVDLGTSAVKIIQVDHTGKLLASISNSYECDYPQPNYSQQDPNDWLNATLLGIKEVVKLSKRQVKAISFSGQMHGLVLLDDNDEILRPAILWNDQRTIKECDYLNNVVGLDKIGMWTGNKALTGFTAPKLLWVKNNEPEIFSKIGKIMLPKDYLIYKLANVFVSDVSDASGTLYFDVKNRQYSKEMLDILCIKEEMLPTIHESYEVVANNSLDDNYLKEVKFIVGGGDQAVGAVGTGSVVPGTCSIALGTSGVVFVATDSFVVDDNYTLHSFAHANGKNHLMGVMLSAAGSLKWWYEGVLNNKTYQNINDEISNANTNNLFFLPYLVGERTPLNDSEARGVFIGLDIKTTACDMSRSVIEGVSFALRDSLELVKKLDMPINKVRISGGGAKNHLWVQILANIFNLPIEILEIEEGPAYGAAILAMVGNKEYKNVIEACNVLVRVKKVFYPILDDVKYYENKYQKFVQIYPSIKNLYPILNK